MREARPGPLSTASSRAVETVGLKKASKVFHSLATGCGEDHSRVKVGLVPTPGRPDGTSKEPVRVAGDRQRRLSRGFLGTVCSHRWKAPRARQISFFFAEARVMRPSTEDASCRRAHAQAWYALGLCSFGCVVSRSAGSHPSRGLGPVWWDRPAGPGRLGSPQRHGCVGTLGLPASRPCREFGGLPQM